MIRSSSLKRGRIEGNDAWTTPQAGHDSKRVRRTISDERNKSLRGLSVLKGLPPQRSISVGTYERGIAMGRKGAIPISPYQRFLLHG